MIDVHTHILPGIDDGAQDVKTSVAMLEMLARQGVTDVIATPHFKPRFETDINNFLTERNNAYGKLMQSIGGRADLPKIRLGSEVTLCVDMAQMNDLPRLCIEGTGYMLTELDIHSFGSWVFNSLYEIRLKQSITPIIAHIDRYIHVLRRDAISDLMALGCPVQFNVSALLHRAVRKDMIALIDRYPDQICLIGTDCHDIVYRKPEIDKFVKKADKYLGEGFLNYDDKRANMLINGKLIY